MTATKSAAPYCTLFVCTLQQQTALSVGGSEGDEDDTLHDMSLARDGDGRPVLNGRTLAGALVATARTFLQVPDDISMSNGAPDDIARPPSVWSVWNAHLVDSQNRHHALGQPPARGPASGSRVGNALRHDTRAAASGTLFNTEVLPAGERWRLLVEVWHPPLEQQQQGATRGQRAAAILALALHEWQRGRCWIGRRVARGMGWMRLESCEVVSLPRTEAAVDSWPNASLSSLDRVHDFIGADLCRLEHASKETLDQYAERCGAHAGERQPLRAYVRWPLRIGTGVHVCDRASEKGISYGLDVVSVGAHGGDFVSAGSIGDAHIVRATEQKWEAYEKQFAPDFPVAMQAADGGGLQPMLPASAIASAWRHYLSRQARAAGHQVLDPSTGVVYGAGREPACAQEGGDLVAALFGHVLGKDAEASTLLLRDAELSAKDWRVALLEKVALDEFTQGAFSGAKFNRMAVLQGAWSFDLVQQVDKPASVPPANWEWPASIDSATRAMRRLLEAARQRRIAVGGGEFRAYGHLPVTLRELGCEWALAGDDWAAWSPPVVQQTQEPTT